MYRYIILLIVISLFGCVERYDFVVGNTSEGIVIESYISNKSYNNTLAYPSDGRYFKVKLSKTSDVKNVKTEIISRAKVFIADDFGRRWNYVEDWSDLGSYYIYDENFSAKIDRKYKLNVELSSGQKFESKWEELPSIKTEVGDVSFIESSVDKYVYQKQGEKVLKNFRGIDVRVKTPANSLKESKYFKWNFDPIWIYIAPESQLQGPYHKCWVRSPYYLKDIVLQKDNIGEYDKSMFFIETDGNERVYEYFSVLIVQAELTKDNFYFWKDFESQKEKGGLYDQPPFNLPTNFVALNSDWTVNGYFGVMTENALRWEFDIRDLSYPVYNDIAELCKIDYGPAAGLTDCESCMEYTKGTPVNVAPLWWDK